MPGPSKLVSDFNGTMFEEKDEASFFKGLFYELLSYKIIGRKFKEVKQLFKIKSETERKIEKYRQSLTGAAAMSLEEKLKSQAEQLKIIYGEFNEKVISDPLVNSQFISEYTARFAKKKRKKLYDDVLSAVNEAKGKVLRKGILSGAYREEIVKLLEESGNLEDYGIIAANRFLTHGNQSLYVPDDSEIITFFLTGFSEKGDAKEFPLVIRPDNKVDILKSVFFRYFSFDPRETVYVGDSISDIPCFDSVQYPVLALPVSQKINAGKFDDIEPELLQYCAKTQRMRMPCNRDEFYKAITMD